MAYFGSEEEEQQGKKQNNNTSNNDSSDFQFDISSSSSDKSPETKGTGHVNLNNYLDANQDSSGVNNSTQFVTDNYEIEEQDYTDWVKETSENIDEYAYDSEFFDSMESGDYSDEQFQQWLDYQKIKYDGPQSARDAEGWLEQSKRNDDIAWVDDNLGSQAAREAMLRDSVKGTYSQGQGMLDAFLLGGTDAGKAFQESTSQINQTNKDNFRESERAIESAIGKEKADIAAIQGDTDQTTQRILTQQDRMIHDASNAADKAYSELFETNQGYDKLSEVLSDLGIELGDKTEFIDTGKFNKLAALTGTNTITGPSKTTDDVFSDYMKDRDWKLFLRDYL